MLYLFPLVGVVGSFAPHDYRKDPEKLTFFFYGKLYFKPYSLGV